MKKDYVSIIGFTVLTIGIIIVSFIGFRIMKLTNGDIKEQYTQIMFDISDPYTEPKVIEYLKDLRVKYPEVALAQMKLESANGTSKIFKQNNNLFGMKVPKYRPTTSLGEKNNHSYYSHWRQSVIDYAMWQAYIMDPDNISTEADYIDYINRMYSEDGSYKQKILKILKHINTPK